MPRYTCTPVGQYTPPSTSILELKNRDLQVRSPGCYRTSLALFTTSGVINTVPVLVGVAEGETISKGRTQPMKPVKA
jgi:hypothetical protein